MPQGVEEPDVTNPPETHYSFSHEHKAWNIDFAAQYSLPFRQMNNEEWDYAGNPHSHREQVFHALGIQ